MCKTCMTNTEASKASFPAPVLMVRLDPRRNRRFNRAKFIGGIGGPERLPAIVEERTESWEIVRDRERREVESG